MDLEDWEILPDDGFLQIHDDGGKMIFSRKYASDSKNEFNMNYFICPTPKSPQFVDTTVLPPRVPNQIVPFQFQETPNNDQEEVIIAKEVITKVPLEIKAPDFGDTPKSPQFVDTTVLPPRVPNQIVPFQFQETPNNDQEEVIIAKEVITKVPLEINAPDFGENHDQFSQVFFKKMKENEFEIMKMDSPKSNNKTILSQIDADPFQYEEKEEDLEVDKEMVIKKSEENSNGGLNLLNKSLNGIGAICSFGVAAAATICIIFIGSHQKHKQNQKLRFQIFTDDKRIKQVVHHATRLNEAISAVREVPVTRAHITVGGYYDAL